MSFQDIHMVAPTTSNLDDGGQLLLSGRTMRMPFSCSQLKHSARCWSFQLKVGTVMTPVSLIDLYYTFFWEESCNDLVTCHFLQGSTNFEVEKPGTVPGDHIWGYWTAPTCEPQKIIQQIFYLIFWITKLSALRVSVGCEHGSLQVHVWPANLSQCNWWLF